MKNKKTKKEEKQIEKDDAQSKKDLALESTKFDEETIEKWKVRFEQTLEQEYAYDPNSKQQNR